MPPERSLYNHPPSASQISDSMNAQIFDRNFPTQPLQPYLNVRPVMTKYAIMPIVDPRSTNVGVSLTVQPTYNPHTTFNPGTRNAPWSGFASNVNLESELRNQVFALQHCDQRVYVPSSHSDLYTLTKMSAYPAPIGGGGSGGNIDRIDPQIEQTGSPFQQLFKQDSQPSFNPNTFHSCNGLFNNSSRVAIKNLTGKQTFC